MSTHEPDGSSLFDAEAALRALAVAAVPYARPYADRCSPVPAELDRAVAADDALRRAAIEARRWTLRQIAARLVGLLDPADLTRFAPALLAVPRERFVLPEDIAASADDAPTPLDAAGLSTVSAPHAYVLTYHLIQLAEGDHLIELGTGTGYGAALASQIVGPRGAVTSIEIDATLHDRARRLLASPDARGPAPITLLHGDGRALAPEAMRRAAAQGRPVAAAVTYALPASPEDLLAALPEGGRLAAPVGTEEQLLRRWTREQGALRETIQGPVRYVSERR